MQECQLMGLTSGSPHQFEIEYFYLTSRICSGLSEAEGLSKSIGFAVDRFNAEADRSGLTWRYSNAPIRCCLNASLNCLFMFQVSNQTWRDRAYWYLIQLAIT